MSEFKPSESKPRDTAKPDNIAQPVQVKKEFNLLDFYKSYAPIVFPVLAWAITYYISVHDFQVKTSDRLEASEMKNKQLEEEIKQLKESDKTVIELIREENRRADVFQAKTEKDLEYLKLNNK